MKDVNKALRTTYFTALTATNEDAYYSQAPDDKQGNYIVFNALNSTPINTKNSTQVNINVQVSIYTEGGQYNDGDAADNIAEKIYQQILPSPTHVLSMSSPFQMVWTELVSDNTNSWRLKNQVIAIDRVITFRHVIYVR